MANVDLQKFCDELRARVSIVDVVGSKVKLIRKGREYQACCPFHNEKNPSFTVNEAKGFYHCFGCGAHGDIIKFEMEANNLPFIDAVKKLADKAGLPMPVLNKEQHEEHEKKKNLYDIMELACKFFEKSLRMPEGAKGLDYFHHRGLEDDIIRKFRLGYAPNNNALKAHLSSQGITDKEMNELGINDCDIHVTTCEGDATEYTKKYLEANKEFFVRVYACGGDGTLNETVNGVFGYTNAAVGVIPIGSGNDFIKSFPEYEEKDFLNLKRMIFGELKPIDAIKSCGRVSINIMSVGFDAATTKGMAKYKKLPLVSGSVAYDISLVKCLFTSRRNRYAYEIDGVSVPEAEGDYLFTIMANGKWYGGGFNAAPNAEFDDGNIELIRIKTVSIPTLVKLVGLFRRGEHMGWIDLVTATKCKSVKIISKDPIDLNLDGEIIECKDPFVEIVPSAIKIILPKK